MTQIPGAREIPDPEAEMERLAALRKQTADAIYVPAREGLTMNQIRDLQDALNEAAAGKVTGKIVILPARSKVV